MRKDCSAKGLLQTSYDPHNFTGTALSSPLSALFTKTSYL
jgi:hypothetical protein